MFDPEHEGTTFIQGVRNYTPNNIITSQKNSVFEVLEIWALRSNNIAVHWTENGYHENKLQWYQIGVSEYTL